MPILPEILLRLAFMEVDIQYRFRLAPPASRAAIAIEAHDYAGLLLSPIGAVAGNLLRWYLRHPVLALQVLGIYGEAAKLWLKSMRLHPRPKPPGDPISIVSAGTQRGSTV